ncbi:MAG: hypothetical protein HGA37_01715 [Lentimicrobium sp.]|nr:hypothetical protein [Lentimicrobium sp.]
MDLPDAEAIVIELGCRWFYVAVENRTFPEWQVFDQSCYLDERLQGEALDRIYNRNF